MCVGMPPFGVTAAAFMADIMLPSAAAAAVLAACSAA
jgi:hypothetical protein